MDEKMFRHKQNVILLVKKTKATPREEYVKKMNGKAIGLCRDFMKNGHKC